jgi:hypothetical protein
MIDWRGFLLVAFVSIASAAALVAVFATGIRLLAVEPRGKLASSAAFACFGVAALGVLFGIYLIVPSLHRS